MPVDITQPADDGVTTGVVTWTPPTASDNTCLASLTSSHKPGDTFPLGATIVTYTARDPYAHEITDSFTVTIIEGKY